MHLLEHSDRSDDAFMKTPFPTKLVALLYEDAVQGSSAGTNFGSHIAILRKYDVDNGSHEADFAASNGAQEVAHYYWSGNTDWVDEGASDLLAIRQRGGTIGHSRRGDQYSMTRTLLPSVNLRL